MASPLIQACELPGIPCSPHPRAAGSITLGFRAIESSAMKHKPDMHALPGCAFAMTLGSTYLLLCLALLVQLARSLCYRRPVLTFKNAFLGVSFFTVALRVVFWWGTDLRRWPVGLSFVLYFLPVAINTSLLALVILYYARYVSGVDWANKQRSFSRRWLFCNIGYSLIVIALGILLGHYHSNTPTKTQKQATVGLLDVYYILGAIVCLVLTGAASAVAQTVRTLSKSHAIPCTPHARIDLRPNILWDGPRSLAVPFHPLLAPSLHSIFPPQIPRAWNSSAQRSFS